LNQYYRNDFSIQQNSNPARFILGFYSDFSGRSEKPGVEKPEFVRMKQAKYRCPKSKFLRFVHIAANQIQNTVLSRQKYY